MRLFVAVEISLAVATSTLRLVDDLRVKAARLAPHSRITWVTPERLHLTVRFIGHVGDEKAVAIAEALRTPIGVEPFELTVSGTGAFPPRGTARVIWAGLTAGSDRLAGVERIVSERLDVLDVHREDRPFNPHLTLGRIREAGGLRTAALLEGLHDVVLGSTAVDAITLFESRLSPKGPTYVPIQSTRLAGDL